MIRRFSITQVVDKTGLEESEIRYFENAFKEFLTFTEMGLDKNDFTEDHIAILLRIKELVHKRGFTVDEVKRELKSFIKNIHVKPPKPVKGPSYARVIAITSGKGGVGKTSVVVNLACVIAQTGLRVGIFDADLGLANVHILMGVKPRFNLSHVVQGNFALEDVITKGPLGIPIISGGQGVREMANLNDEQRRVLLRQIDALEREVDVLLVDTGAGISENVLRFATFADEVIAVTTPNLAANADCFSIIKILLEMEPRSKIGVVTNQVQDKYDAKNVFNRLGTAARQHLRYELNDLGHVVDSEHMRVSVTQRRPLVMSYPHSEPARNFQEIVSTIFNEKVFMNSEKQSSFADLMGCLKRNMTGPRPAAAVG
ncbi:MAG: P-loop NTPase [Candidatus Sumerlaeaceae bacterium]|nr:P-loop NTPase [Candidatus Sumerlaeaceae bacterium]